MDETARRTEAKDLDERLLAIVGDWRAGRAIAEKDIDRLFCDVAAHQLRFNAAYLAYARTLPNFEPEPRDWRNIPAVPASAFKDAILTSFPAAEAAACFQTSGTTAARKGRHFMETTALYDAAAEAIFDRLVLGPLELRASKLRILNLTPSAADRQDSSLGHMVAHFKRVWGDEQSADFIHGDELDAPSFVQAIEESHMSANAVCIIGTAIAYARLLQALGVKRLPLPHSAFVVETGGFKGREFDLDRVTFYENLARCFAIKQSAIIAELGMTELSSQYYDSPGSREKDLRVKSGPPWLRTRIMDSYGNDAASGTLGSIRHYDLANRSSVTAVDTEDLGVKYDDGFLFAGRNVRAELRGCSLDAEGLRTLMNF